MPIVTETEVEGYAHCHDPRCPGHTQQQVAALRRETAFTFRERGGAVPGVESSVATLSFAEEGEAVCPHCGRPREVSDQRRRSYTPLSGHDPLGLLKLAKFDPAKQAEIQARPLVDEERRELQEQNAALADELAVLQGQVAELAARVPEGVPPEELDGPEAA